MHGGKRIKSRVIPAQGHGRGEGVGRTRPDVYPGPAAVGAAGRLGRHLRRHSPGSQPGCDCRLLRVLPPEHAAVAAAGAICESDCCDMPRHGCQAEGLQLLVRHVLDRLQTET